MEEKKVSIRLKQIILFREMFLSLLVFAVIILMSIFIPEFLSSHNIKTTLVGLSSDGIIAIGMTMALVVGGIDLSVGSVMALSTVIAGMFFIRLNLNIWIGVFLALVFCSLIGYFISYCINIIKLNPFITTLSVMSLARGLAFIITKGTAISLGNIDPTFDFIGHGKFFGIPISIWILIILCIFIDTLMRNSKKFRNIYYVGSNEKAAKLSGINVERVKIMVYVCSALFAGIAGIITLSRFGVVMPNLGTSSELRTIAGAVIGGASLTGGRGSILGTILGLLLIALVNNALILLNVSIYWQTFITGLVLFLAVILDRKLDNERKNK